MTSAYMHQIPCFLIFFIRFLWLNLIWILCCQIKDGFYITNYIFLKEESCSFRSQCWRPVIKIILRCHWTGFDGRNTAIHKAMWNHHVLFKDMIYPYRSKYDNAYAAQLEHEIFLYCKHPVTNTNVNMFWKWPPMNFLLPQQYYENMF